MNKRIRASFNAVLFATFLITSVISSNVLAGQSSNKSSIVEIKKYSNIELMDILESASIGAKYLGGSSNMFLVDIRGSRLVLQQRRLR